MQRQAKVVTPLYLLLASSGVSMAAGQDDRAHRIEVEGPRPLAAALELLEQRQATVVSYEDPIYVHDSDLEELTHPPHGETGEAESGESLTVLIPRTGRIEASYTVAAGTGRLENPRATIQSLLDLNSSEDNPGRFRLVDSGDRLHVVPSLVKNPQGRLAPTTSVLDAKITLAAEERSGAEALSALCAAVTDRTRHHVLTGLIPFNLFAQRRATIEAADETARDVLVRILRAMEAHVPERRKFTWQLFYDPGLKRSYLNVHLVLKGSESGE